MHLNGKDIEKQCNRKCLINGRALYASKAVNHLSVSNDYGDVKEYIVSHVPQEEQEEICAHLPAQEDACTVYTAKAEVTGSTGRQYQVSFCTSLVPVKALKGMILRFAAIWLHLHTVL